MESARLQLAEAIAETPFQAPRIPIYQNVTAQAATDVEDIQTNLIKQLTGSVKWTQSVAQMCQDGATSFVEIGPGNVLQGLIKKINRSAQTASGQSLL